MLLFCIGHGPGFFSLPSLVTFHHGIQFFASGVTGKSAVPVSVISRENNSGIVSYTSQITTKTKYAYFQIAPN